MRATERLFFRQPQKTTLEISPAGTILVRQQPKHVKPFHPSLVLDLIRSKYVKIITGKVRQFCRGFLQLGIKLGGGGKLSNLFRLAQLSSWLSRRLKKPAALVGIESFVALSLVIYYFFLMLPMSEAPRHYDNDVFNRGYFTEYSHHPFIRWDFSKDFPDVNTRLPGAILTGQLTDMVLDYTIANKSDVQKCSFGIGAWRYNLFKCTFAAYHASWLLLLFGLLIRYRADALLIILGTFSGLMLNVSLPSYQEFFPWDLPSLFFFSWAVLTYDNSKRILPLMAVVWLGALFKETTLCCSLLILLGEHWPLKKRIFSFAGTVAAFAIAKKFLLLAYAVPVHFFSASNFFSGLRLPYNFQVTFSHPALNHVIFVNAGALLIMMILPWRTYRERLFKLLAGVFITGIFLFGRIIEFRVWYEILPLGWMMISEALSNHSRIIQEKQAGSSTLQPASIMDDRTRRVMTGSYWLMMGGLLFILVGVLIIADLTPSKPEESNPSDQSATQSYNPFSTPKAMTNLNWTLSAGWVNTNGSLNVALIHLNNAAWLFATSPKAEIRDGQLAVDLAEGACEMTHYQETFVVGTLAAAYAEAGRFEEAISTAQKACALASARGEPELLERNQELLELYRAHKPFHQAATPEQTQ